MTSKGIIFLDLTSSHATIELPPLWYNQLVSMTVAFWSADGINFAYNEAGHLLGPFYAQLRLGDLPDPVIISSTGLGGLIPLPLLVHGGWPPPPVRLDIPIGKCYLPRRLSVDIYRDGQTKQPLELTRATIWLEVTFMAQ